MARRRTRTRSTSTSAPAGKTTIVRVNASPPARRRRVGRRRSGGGGSVTSGIPKLAAMAAGGLAVGLVEKTFPDLPTVPVIGKKGTIALAAHFLAGSLRIPALRDVANAAAVLAGYELGKDGRVSGDYEVDGDYADDD